MIKKVTLDTLDIEEPTISLAEEHLPEEPPGGKGSWKPWVRWSRPRLFLISGAALFVICCAGLLLFFFVGPEKEARHAPPPAQKDVPQSTAAQKEARHAPPPAQKDVPQSTAAQAVAPEAGKADLVGQPRFILKKLNNFLIPLKNDKKNNRLLAIDMELEVDSARHQLFQEKIVLIRGGIYQAIQRSPGDIPQGKKGMEAMRGIIIASLETTLGKGFIKNVWFTKFIVL
jgi:flagellar basal body-associated protein FliL